MSDTTFKLEIKGIKLSDTLQKEISLALNDTLMRKLGELDLHKSPTPGGLLTNWWLINGGKLEWLARPDLNKAISEAEKLSNVAGALGARFHQ